MLDLFSNQNNSFRFPPPLQKTNYMNYDYKNPQFGMVLLRRLKSAQVFSTFSHPIQTMSSGVVTSLQEGCNVNNTFFGTQPTLTCRRENSIRTTETKTTE